ncbi:MAG TPA: DUF4118 domain-containing protein [Acidimicrobiales bacterium]|nr:DUF4118 domain-containing protein [Acidimicrobiales bacterium]
MLPYDPVIHVGTFRGTRLLLTSAAAMLPIAAAAAWIPFRSDLPNTTIALIIVLVVGIAASAGGRWAAAFAAITGTAAFDLFDTAPYGQLIITRARDVVTAVAVLVAGLVVGEVCARLTNYRSIADQRGEDFAVMSAAAGLVALGEDAAVVVRALAGELQSLLGLEDCEFEFGPPSGKRLCVSRDGTLVRIGPEADGDREVDLPVWLGGEVVGCYRMTTGLVAPTKDRLAVALGIAEQAGAALAGCQPDPTTGTGRRRRMHLVR